MRTSADHGRACKSMLRCGGGDIYALTPGNVIITSGKDIAFTNCTFQRLGAYGVSAGGGSQRVSWSRCTFRDISAGALMLGEISDCTAHYYYYKLLFLTRHSPLSAKFPIIMG